MANPLRVGSGDHVYTWDSRWAKLPPGVALGYTHGVVVDQRDNVYIFNQSKDAICIFKPDGMFIKSWGADYMDGAHGLYLSVENNGEEYLYLIDYVLQKVVKTTLDGEVLMTIGIPDRPDLYPDTAKYKPTDVCVTPSGMFYVMDGYGSNYIHQYDLRGNYMQSFGGTGSEPGELKCPHGAWVDTRGNKDADPELYVADRGNNRVQVFTLDGQHKRFIVDDETMRRPCCFYQWKDEMIIPHLDARMTIWNADDKPVAVIGDNPEAPQTEGWPNIQSKLQDGKFNSPHAACADSKGDIYVVEWISTGRITKLTRQK